MHLYGRVTASIRSARRLRRRTIIKAAAQVLFLAGAFALGIEFDGWLLRVWSFPLSTSRDRLCTTTEFGQPTQNAAWAHFPPPENDVYRVPDTLDTFARYKHRSRSTCNISSLDLHMPFGPLCSTRADLLAAFSGGGRIGFDTPFIPRGCDMRWYTTEEVCEVLGRFEKVIVVGDSMMRHVVAALNVLLRKDLGYGGVTAWNFNEEELENCFCNHQMDVKACSIQGIYSTTSVIEHDPNSLACSQPFDLVIELMLRFPLDPLEVSRFKALIANKKPSRPYAFVFGHGLWNDLDLQATLNWLDGINHHAIEQAPYLERSLWPRLIVTPNAAGTRKPDQWILTQGDKALQIFEHSVRDEAAKRGVEHLGTWNMSIQTEKYDGVHLDLKGNLVKAMGVVNWLAKLDLEQW
ncbi:uncharacterized protein HMPREF1541_00672 [Cyphellophora europaea CBS 101466]|uniref:Uncharacterized protein n=1 Tax=Cyphellophora europaea (strain CBS 101466) TaxID=1220924 RepID=W2SCR8_CYPE1|nr:uncharacterized protein HMPREF1541_00672 [Cyphellophora europaea CBS 101466]ETN46487.1 hypothetical protein HMPREF1541_00672 [Cyphellophora europaea CBS 101466]